MLFCCAAVPHSRAHPAGTFAIQTPPGPYVGPGTIAVDAGTTHGPVSLRVDGPGSVDGLSYTIPAVTAPQRSLLVATAPGAVAIREIGIVPPPASSRKLIAVASYYDGIALHDAKTFALLGFVPTPGAPGDVAFGSGGALLAPMTGGNALVSAQRDPWKVESTGGVPMGNEVVTASGGDVFISNRDVEGKGALTRVRGGSVERVVTGITAEGLALDERAHRIYVGNVNDASIAEVDTGTLHVLRRFAAAPRVFGLALDPARARLFAVSNQDPQMRKGGGYVVALDLRSGRRIARSGDLPFPLGAAYDATRSELFVTDEDTGNVNVLDGTTLKPRRAPLRACDVPWRPRYDAARSLLFVPCTRANRIYVLDVRTMRPLKGSPFPTGRYPLGVATSPL